eukprot:CAMPEP_0175939784 /NCGR_PEP_ID=MMETSP0108-20121206/23450_1 /TAXON_ID=195067 ORGANISM="Goniomonas pacifica, Strain CCMP1869" /NCGR_SAMPLE_ID=MMETSP0108 /ASSEMBLY_ACC=CAM_ASM_000204 /LENGTH=112 /DNA_ID=CAMNT_0017264197 /DNA_START=377 /DNA_END=716 /DNA_ORIENTATION=+
MPQPPPRFLFVVSTADALLGAASPGGGTDAVTSGRSWPQDAKSGGVVRELEDRLIGHVGHQGRRGHPPLLRPPPPVVSPSSSPTFATCSAHRVLFYIVLRALDTVEGSESEG